MGRLVQANSFPYMAAGFSDVQPSGEDMLTLDLLNRGVGPAHEESLQVTVDGRYVRSVDELVSAALGTELAAKAKSVLHTVHNRVPTRFIPGGQSQPVFRIPKSTENEQYFELLAKDTKRWDVALCYCSVFQECWQVRGKWLEPEPIRECRRDESREFIP
jgi:hypothetical protein